MEGKYLNIIKDIYRTNPEQISYSMTISWKLFLQEQEQHKDAYLLFPFLSNTILKVLVRERKEIKGIRIGKEEMKLPPSVKDIILYAENSKNVTKKLLEPIHKIRKLGEYYYNVQNLLCFYTLITNYQKKKLRKQSHL